MTKKPKPKSFDRGHRSHLDEQGQYVEILQIIPATNVMAVFVEKPGSEDEDEELSRVPVIVWALVKTELDINQWTTVDVRGMVLSAVSQDLAFAGSCDGFKEYEYD